jgi:hypothetical protein
LPANGWPLPRSSLQIALPACEGAPADLNPRPGHLPALVRGTLAAESVGPTSLARALLSQPSNFADDWLATRMRTRPNRERERP